jgi:hypothetical protein
MRVAGLSINVFIICNTLCKNWLPHTLSWLDFHYCIYAGFLRFITARLQRVLHAAANLILGFWSGITSVRRCRICTRLPWLTQFCNKWPWWLMRYTFTHQRPSFIYRLQKLILQYGVCPITQIKISDRLSHPPRIYNICRYHSYFQALSRSLYNPLVFFLNKFLMPNQQTSLATVNHSLHSYYTCR